MYPAKDARELAILLRISRELDVVGDVTATVDNPSELLAWTLVLGDAEVVAWRAGDSGHRYLHVTARRSRAPIRGCVTAVLPCEQHQEFWNALGLDQLAAGDRRPLGAEALSSAWAVMPVSPTAPSPGPENSDDTQPPPITESS
jgi:hypothetical protein